MKLRIFSLKALSLFFVSVFFMVSCQKEPAVAPCLMFDGKATCSIATLVDSIMLSSNLPDIVITGVVVSTDKNGAFYKQLVIQDETGGIQIKVANNSLNTRYKIGQRVFVKCKGLALGTYYSNPMLGIGDSTNVEAIPASKECTYIYRHDMPTSEPKPFIITSNTGESELISHLNMLVEIPNCHFATSDVGSTFVDPNGATPYTSRAVECGNQSTLAVNTSKYVDASIGQTTVPSGTGTLRGVLTLYKGSYGKGTYQIVLRSIKDVGFTWYSDNYILNEHLSEPNYGWTFVNNGAAWQTKNNNFLLEATDENTDSWCVSPALDLSGNTSAAVAFDKFYVTYVNDVCDLYYTTSSFGGSINASNWTKVEAPAYQTGGSYNNYELTIPVSAKHIAFRFKGNSGDAKKACLQNIVVKTEKRN